MAGLSTAFGSMGETCWCCGGFAFPANIVGSNAICNDAGASKVARSRLHLTDAEIARVEAIAEEITRLLTEDDRDRQALT